MAMQTISKMLLATAVAATATSAVASGFTSNPYLGIEYKLQYLEGKDNWADVLPKDTYHNGTLFVGIRFHDYFAGELGITQSDRRKKDSSLSSFFGTSQADFRHNVRVRLRSWHLDLNGLYPANDDFNWIATVGFASAKSKVNFTKTGGSTNSLAGVTGKSKLVPRLGLGAQYTQGMFGVRLRALWEGTSRLRFEGVPSAFSNATDKPYKSSFSMTLGGFLRW